MVIDAHLHIGLNNWSESNLLETLDRNGIDKAWILTWDEQNPILPNYYIPLDIDVVARAYRNHPDRIVPFYAPDPARKNWKQLLQKRLDEGFAGCGELKVPYRWDAPVVQQLLEFLDDHALPLVFHMERARKVFFPEKDSGVDWVFKRLINERFNGKSAQFILHYKNSIGLGKKYLDNRLADFPGYLLGFDELKKALRAYENIKFVAHGPHFWNHFSNPEKPYLFLQRGKLNGRGEIWNMLETFPNLYCDISGYSGFRALSRDPDFSRTFLEKFHGKILYGTDNTALGLKEMVEKLVHDQSMLDDLFFRNAQGLTGS